jgi:hypothetical protein
MKNLNKEKYPPKAIVATVHAYERAKERLNWNQNALNRMMVKAYVEGIQHKDTKSLLYKHIEQLHSNNKNCNNIRIYGEVIYFFSDKRLITLYQLKNEYKKYIQLSK